MITALAPKSKVFLDSTQASCWWLASSRPVYANLLFVIADNLVMSREYISQTHLRQSPMYENRHNSRYGTLHTKWSGDILSLPDPYPVSDKRMFFGMGRITGMVALFIGAGGG
jgi:hypothetical protein